MIGRLTSYVKRLMMLKVPIPKAFLPDYRRLLARDNFFRLVCLHGAFMLLRVFVVMGDIADAASHGGLPSFYLPFTFTYLFLSLCAATLLGAALLKGFFSTPVRRMLYRFNVLFFIFSQLGFFFFEYRLTNTGFSYIISLIALSTILIHGFWESAVYTLLISAGAVYIAEYYGSASGWGVQPHNVYLIALTLLCFLVSRLLHFLYNKNFVGSYHLTVSNRQLQVLNDDLERLSSTDHLTQIPNRRAFDTQMDYLWNLCKRQNQSFSLLMIDIDDFSLYNNKLGHLQGDECLKKVSACLKRCFRRSVDFVSRFGGEEFVVLMPFSKEDEAYRMSEYVRTEVESMRISHPDSLVSRYVTVSIGACTFCPAEGGTPSGLIGGADEALYRAKNSGKNRCSV